MNMFRHYNIPEDPHLKPLAHALQSLGIEAGDRIGTLCWNSSRHLELYFAVPCAGYVLHTLNLRLAPEQLAYIQDLAKRSQVIRNRGVDPKTDNMLKVSTDGRKAGLDMRLVDPAAEDFRDSKVNKAVDNVVRIWKDGNV